MNLYTNLLTLSIFFSTHGTVYYRQKLRNAREIVFLTRQTNRSTTVQVSGI